MNSVELAWKIRRHAVEMTHISGASHIGSILSVADIVAVLYGEVMNIFPDDPQNIMRDRFILSKGHAGAAVYAALAETGFFSVSKLSSYHADGSNLSGHVSHKGVPGVEISTGSLGHGLGVGAGMAYAAKLDNRCHKIYVVIGDGEIQEGSVWEAIIFASWYKLNNLVMIVDNNKMQALGFCDKVLGLGNLGEKIRTFGWEVKVVDGHDHRELKEAMCYNSKDKPVCVIANTVKGKGVAFMENAILWHYRDPQGEDYIKAVEELERNRP